ncbi:hypothetical protein Dsin_021353 [Dipteronia sinensis]|uniref:Endonuclease/exonuclease/phosphatase domain-containing protein n=1 Tax=Dipteronia sinensis TaxID=43782 RepID=A0AAD9ZZC2_9ROSI|nr:hypothetical protein Dsin_021353 [Dipteronia sinensis]
MSWNIRGLGRVEKIRVVRNLVSIHRPTFLFIQESKLNSFNSKVFSSIGGSWLFRGMGVASVGATGGLISMWNDELFVVKACITNNCCIIIAGELVKLDKNVVFCNVYAPNIKSKRVKLWEFILRSQYSFDIPLCIGCDFNTVLCEMERRGCECNQVSVRNFNTFMLQKNVVNIPSLRNVFT